MNLFCNILFILFLYISTAQSETPTYYICNENSKTRYGSKISRNIDILLSDLVPATLLDGFSATSYGVGPNRVFGLAQCRADVSKKDCSNCIQNAATDILNTCTDIVDARIWYTYCFLRYDKVNFFDQIDTSGVYFYTSRDVTGVDNFSAKLGSLMKQISSDAVKPENNGLGKAKSEISSSLTLYGLVQCTRDLSTINCAQCLATAIENIPNFCPNKRGCRAVYSSCFARYDLYPIYFPLGSRKSLAHSSVDDESIMVVNP